MLGGQVRSREEMIEYLDSVSSDHLPSLDGLYQYSMKVQGGEHLDDDFSILCVTFQ
jgi:hypothetical protein